MNSRLLAGVLVVLVAVAPCMSALASGLAFVPHEVIVKLSAGSPEPDFGASGYQSRWLGNDKYLVAAVNTSRNKLDPEAATYQLANSLASWPEIEYAHENFLVELSTIHNGVFPYDWVVVPDDPLPQWHSQGFGMLDLAWWYASIGDELTTIGILDTGRTDHPDLINKWHPTLEFNAAQPGTSVYDNSNWRHGTIVAAVAGSQTNNAIGGVGVCPLCSLVPIKIQGNDGTMTVANVVSGVTWAVSNGVDILNMSFEIDVGCEFAPSLQALREEIASAIDAGTVVVAAAGNGGTDAQWVSPASCDGVISVAGLDQNGNLAPYSNYGNVTLAAPGGGGYFDNHRFGEGVGCPADPDSGFNPSQLGVLSAWTTSPSSGSVHCYRYLSGTSLASPYIAGVVGLLLSDIPWLTPDQIRTVLTFPQVSYPVDSCPGGCGSGIVDPYLAIIWARNTFTDGYGNPYP